MAKETIRVGDYIVIQRQNYKKLHKYNKAASNITLGKDNVDLSGIDGCKYHSVFRMIPTGQKRHRSYSLELVKTATNLDIAMYKTDSKYAGVDNRNINDDGFSQKLSAIDIEELKFDATSASDIVSTLISNSNTFHNKTEYSQEKYLKKKEKKYFEYIQIKQPNLRLVSEILHKVDSNKIQGIRLDTLSQIITAANINSDGVHLLYDSGTNGLVAASLLKNIGAGTDGKLINMHPGNMSQKQALLAMNFDVEQYDRCISVNIYSVLRQYYQGCDTHHKPNDTLKRSAADDLCTHKAKVPKLEENENTNDECIDTPSNGEKNVTEPKKPKWHYDNIKAAKFLKLKTDSLVIACKEDPLNIFNELVAFVKPGRPFVVYNTLAEPLQHLYMALKCQSNVAALKLTCNWMRNYQILPDRTHPDVMMNGSSGFLLSGFVLK